MPNATASTASGGLSEDIREMLLDAEIAAIEMTFATSIAADLFKLIEKHKVPATDLPGYHRLVLSDLELDRLADLLRNIEAAAQSHASAVSAIVAATGAGSEVRCARNVSSCPPKGPSPA